MKIKQRVLEPDELETVNELKEKYGNLFEVKAVGRDKQEYIGYFRPLNLGDYDDVIGNLNNNKTEFDNLLSLAKTTFVAGDSEMVDEENRLDIVHSYIFKMYDLFDPKYCTVIEDGLFTIIKLIDIPVNEINILDYVLEWDEKTKKVTLLKNKTKFKSFPYYEAKFKYPSYTDYKRFLMAYDKGLPVSAGLELAKLCYVEGDKQFLTQKNASYVNSATKYFSEIIKNYDSTLKKK